MRIDKIPTGDNPPESLNVIIEVPTGGEPVKYEFDKDHEEIVRDEDEISVNRDQPENSLILV